MIKRFAVFILILLASQVNAQIIIGGNYDFLIPFGAQKQFHGIQLLIEKPVNERVSYYGNISYFPAQKIKGTPEDYNYTIEYPDSTSFGKIPLSSLTQFSTVGVSFGRRNYWLNPIDHGFSLYGGTTINVKFSFVKSRIENFDSSKYTTITPDPSDMTGKGTVFNPGFGLNGGLKYDIRRFGTLYFDVSFEYSILNYPTTAIASSGFRDFGSPLNFYLGFGYKRIIYWGMNK